MILTEEQVMERLRQAIKDAGNQKQFAAKHGLSPAYVSDVLNGRRELAERILKTIGVKRRITFEDD